jgi:AraC family transcriptional regulator
VWVGSRLSGTFCSGSVRWKARLFRQTLGVSPHQHVIQVRVNNARSLLSAGSGRRSLAEIASAVGFADQSHLTRHFKRITGVTPRQFRG